MRVYRLSERAEVERAYPCLERPDLSWADGLPLSRAWFAANLGESIEGLHLEAYDGQVIGHIYWAPSEKALVPYEIEDHAAFLYCEWVQRPHRGKGYLRQLFQALTAFLRDEGYKGILVDGTEIEEYMHYRHFAKRGFRAIREAGGGRLMYLPLKQETVRVEPLSPRIPASDTERVEILIIGSRSCPVGASAVLAVRKVAGELGEAVLVREVPAGRKAIAHYGVADGIFINGKAKFFGPVTEAQVRQAILAEMAA